MPKLLARAHRAGAGAVPAVDGVRSSPDMTMAVCSSLLTPDFSNFTLEENRGKALFLRNCALCHLPDQDAHFVMILSQVNTGLDEDMARTDGGVGDITLKPQDVGASSCRRCATSRSPHPTCSGTPIRDALEAVDHDNNGGQESP